MDSDELRITGPLLKIVHQFLENPEEQMSGADLAQRTNVASGTLYPILRRLEVAGWLTSVWEDVDPKVVGRPRRRLYKITALGARKARIAIMDTFAPKGVPAWGL
ncbi:MAG TPA: helix-turn-helix transcriptional regulator [Acidobacteriaceae bacterium]